MSIENWSLVASVTCNNRPGRIPVTKDNLRGCAIDYRSVPAPTVNSIKSRIASLSRAAVCATGLFCALPFAPAYAQNLFVGNWADFGKTYQSVAPYTWRIGSQANQWSYLQAKSADRILPEHDAYSPSGGTVAHVLVMPGDNVGYTGERAEVSYMLGAGGAALPVLSTSGHEYYAFSVKLASNWTSPGKNYGTSGCIWGAYLQLHSPDVFDSPPAIAFNADSDLHLTLDTGDLLAGGTLTSYKNTVSYPFSNGSLARGQWVEFVMDVRWAYDNTGSLIVYRRDQGQTSFTPVLTLQNIPTLQSVHGINIGAHYHYWKTGFYRSATPNMTSELWLGPLARGTSIGAVMLRAFPKPI